MSLQWDIVARNCILKNVASMFRYIKYFFDDLTTTIESVTSSSLAPFYISPSRSKCQTLEKPRKNSWSAVIPSLGSTSSLELALTQL